MRLLLFVQVGQSYSIRRDNRFLEVLPCPHTCLCIAYDCFCACQLLVCGDIETNPGPTVEEMFQEILNGQKTIQTNIAEINNRLEATEKAMSSFDSRLGLLEGKVAELQSLDTNTGGLNPAFNNTYKALRSHQRKLTDLEDWSRRSNLVVFGIPEEPNESDEVLREKVIKELFEEKMGVKCYSVARIHRIGKASKRSVILYFQDYNAKQALFKNVKKLKGFLLAE